MSFSNDGQPASHKLKIRRRARSKREKKTNKKADREFLELLEGVEHERAVAFMGVASVDARIHMNTVMKRSTPALRSDILQFLDKLDVPLCEKLLRVMAPLNDTLAAQLFCLQWDLDWDRYLLALDMEQEVMTKFLEVIFDYSPEDRKKVIDKSFECNMSMEMLLNLLMTTSDEPKCPICTARRKIKKEVLRINNLVDKDAAKKFNGRERSIFENELYEKRDFAVNPTTDFYSVKIDAVSKNTVVQFSDASGQAIASHEHTIDTKLLCHECKKEVYEFALRVGNDLELWHAVWQDRLDLHEQARKLDVAKSFWWVQEKRDMEFVETVRVVIQANKNAKKRKRDAKKKLAEEKAKRVAKEAEELKKLIKKNMIKDAVQTDEKWMHQELHSQDKSLKTRNLAASLEFETAYGLYDNAKKERKNPKSTTLLEYHHESGIPLTAEASSEAFGTAPIVVPDETKDIRQWDFQLQEAKEKLDWRKEEQRRQREAAERANFEGNLKTWLEGAQEVTDKINAKYQRQAWLRQKKIEAREEQKRLDKIARSKMHEDAALRAASDAALEIERQHALAAEEKREMHERHEMAICEAHQRAIDRFWGIPTAKEKERRLAEFLRRQFEARIRDKRAMMVAVGGEIKVSKSVAHTVPEQLNLPLYRIKTLMVSGKELCEDPMGLRRPPIGQR